MNQALDVRVHRAMVEVIRRIDRDKVLHKLNELAKEVIECQKCQLGANRARAIPGVGPAHARIMFVGESPSAGAELYGRPFPVAPAKTSIPFAPESGDILQRWLSRLGLPLEWIYFTNLVKCRKRGSELRWDEIRACDGYLQTEIELIKPKLVVALGTYAVGKWFSTPSRVARISEVRGKSIQIDGITYFPLWHPSIVARGAIGINIHDDLSSLSQVLDSLF